MMTGNDWKERPRKNGKQFAYSVNVYWIEIHYSGEDAQDESVSEKKGQTDS